MGGVTGQNPLAWARGGITLRALLIIASGLGALSGAAYGDLILHPDNPHYFQDTATGKAVLIATHGCIAPTTQAIDYKAEVRTAAQAKMPYVRVWHWLPWQGDAAIWPWTTNADGRYDFGSWDERYWSRLRDGIKRCRTARIYAEVMLFEACGMKGAKTRWHNNPWASDNNVNALELPRRDDEGVPAFYDFENKPRVREQQERYLRRLIDETARFANVVYELENEAFSRK